MHVRWCLAGGDPFVTLQDYYMFACVLGGRGGGSICNASAAEVHFLSVGQTTHKIIFQGTA